MGLVGPAGLPEPILQRLNAVLAKILSGEDVKEAVRQSRARCRRPVRRMTSLRFMRDKSARWGEVVRKNGIKIE